MLRHLMGLVAAFVAVPALAQVPPEKAISTMTVADGLQIELFAAEPMLVNPTSIDVDHLGRVWVCEAVNYRRVMFNRPILRPEGDRIVILEDTTGSGKADKSTVFYQGKELIAPIGIAVAPIPASHGVHPRGDGDDKNHGDKPRGSPCRVFVCQSPDILVFEDLDGDGKADGPPKKLLTGFKGFDHDHGVHGINIGPDGKLYFTVGDAGVDGLQSSDGKGRKWKSNSTDCRAGTVWRCDMDGKNLELIAHNFRNNYECCVNSFGEIWLSDNDDDGSQQTRICYVMPGGDYGYHPRGPGQSHWHEEQPGIVHKVLRTGFGSPTGICFYEGTLLPEKYRGQLLHCDAGPREFRCFHIKPKGAGYELEKELLVTSSDTWFRLSDVCVAPDGSVMLADWYDPGVGGHGMGDWTRGRIYRVTPKGHKGYAVPKVDVVDFDGLRAALASPNLAMRFIAFQVFMNMRSNGFSGDALPILGNARWGEDKPWMFGRERWIISQLPEFKKSTRPAESKNSDPSIWTIDTTQTVAFLRMLKDCYRHLSSMPTELQELILSYCRVKSGSAVRRETLLMLRDEESRIVISWFWDLAKLYDGEDHFYRAALNIACGTDPARRDAILADFDKQFPEWNDKVADLVWELRPKSMLPRLENLLVDAKFTPAQKGRIVDILAVYDDPAAGQKLLKLVASDAPAEVKARAIDNLRLFLPTKWKSLKDDHGLAQVMAKLLESKDQQLVALQLASAAPDCANAMEIDRIARDATSNQAVRIAAVRFLGQLGHIKYFHLVEELAKDPILATTAVAAMGNFVPGTGVNSGGKESLEYLGKLVADDKAPAELRSAAINALISTRLGSTWLLKLKQNGQMPESLVADVGRLLRNSPYPDLRNRANLDFPKSGKLDPKKLPAIGVLAKRTGNADKGRQLLTASLKNDALCLKCHTVRGIGGQVGPDLSMIGKKASRENLFESILLPSKAIADQYIQWQIETSKGVQVAGLLIEETPESILLRDANAKDYRIPKKEIESRTKSPVSIMPENIVSAMTEDDLVDLVEYLFQLKTPSLTPDFWHIVGPFPNDASDSGLDAVYEPEKSVDLSATYTNPKRERGKLEWTKVQRNAEGYVDLMAHYAPHSENIMSYLYREIESPVDQEAAISLGTDDGAKLWLNGEQVYSTRAHDAAVPDKARVKVKLKKGVNTMLLKIVNGSNPHGFYLTVLSEQELKAGR